MPDDLIAAHGEGPGGNVRRHHLLTAVRRITSPYWTSRASIQGWIVIAVLALAIYGSVRVGLWTNKYLGDLAAAIAGKHVATMVQLLVIGAWLIVAQMVIHTLSTYLQQHLQIKWRAWLTNWMSERWLAGKQYYRIERDALIDNADQRISDDVALFVEMSIAMAFDLASQLSRMIGYSAIVWTLGGALDLRFIGVNHALPGWAFWASIFVGGASTVMIVVASLPLIRLNVARQRKEADFRFRLATIRMNAESIALYDAAPAEAPKLRGLLGEIAKNWHRLMTYGAGVMAAASYQNSALVVLSLIIGYPRYASGALDFSQMTQLGNAAFVVAYGATWLAGMVAGTGLYPWAAAVRRLDALNIELDHVAVQGIVMHTVPPGHVIPLAVENLALSTPDGTPLAQPGTLSFGRGERWLVQGESGAGKSTLLRGMAGLWPYGIGTIHRDMAARTLFVAQKSYVPEGTLVDALCFPSPPDSFTRAACIEALRLVRLDALIPRLDEASAWQQRLSPGEQQRLAFARLFLQRPDIVLLDEATSALDSGNEQHLYATLIRLLPDAIIVSVAHRDSLDRFHDHRVVLRAATPI